MGVTMVSTFRLGLFAALALPMQAVGAPLTTTATVISVDPSTVSAGDSFTLTATVTATGGSLTGGSPTGSVQMFEAGMSVGSPVPLVPNGGTSSTASLTEIANAAGDFLLVAYSGDSNFEPSSASALLMVLPNAAPAPEPSSIALVLSGIAGLLVLPAASGLGMVRRTRRA
jgi:hypothetical protein